MCCFLVSVWCASIGGREGLACCVGWELVKLGVGVETRVGIMGIKVGVALVSGRRATRGTRLWSEVSPR